MSERTIDDVVLMLRRLGIATGGKTGMDKPEFNSQSQQTFIHLHDAVTGADMWLDPLRVSALFDNGTGAALKYLDVPNSVAVRESAAEIFAEIDRAVAFTTGRDLDYRIAQDEYMRDMQLAEIRKEREAQREKK